MERCRSAQKEVPGCSIPEQPGLHRTASCRVVGLERSTYYDNKHRVPSNQAIRRLLLRDVIGEVHANSRGTYRRLRVQATLRIEHGLIVNQKLVARIMRDPDIHGLPQRKGVTHNLANVATHDDLVNRNFVADRPNASWLTDITEHPSPWIPAVVATPTG